MARRTFDVVDVVRILQHWYVGHSLSDMSASLGMDRKTLRKYIAPALVAGIAPGGQPKSREEWAELVLGWFPELADARLRRVTWSAIGEHHEFIARQLEEGTRMRTIWQRLRNEHDVAVSVASFRRYVTANIRSRQAPDARHTVPPSYRHPRVQTTFRGGVDRQGHPVPQLLGLSDREKQS
jgi:hypothetical protein